MAVMQEIADAVERATDPDVLAAFPSFVRRPMALELSAAERFWFHLIRGPSKALIWLALRPRRGRVGSLDPAEVDRVYSREAEHYDGKHHITTRGQDLNWRRMAAWLVATAPEPRPAVLDLCTGTGLTVVEMVKLLRCHGREADITALDYNEAMLRHARERFERRSLGLNVAFVRGDATALIGPAAPGWTTFPRASFDIVTQMFGIGGISDPVAVAGSVLAVLREGGRFLLIDMHRPIEELPGEWPVPGAWLRFPRLETFSYANTTMPLVLARLWGWRDTTLDFYLAPLLCEDTDGVCYGFRVLSKHMESERWWLALPMMPTCRLLLEKVRIDRAEYERRRRILKLVSVI